LSAIGSAISGRRVRPHCSGQLELAGGLEADGRVIGPDERDDVAVLDHRLPVELGEPGQEVADSAGLVVGGRAVIGGSENELLVFRPNRPAVRSFLASSEGREQVVPALDDRAFAIVRPSGHWLGP
jgi:hypothetical protein